MSNEGSPIEEAGEGPEASPKTSTRLSVSNAGANDVKGNVIVSVRVRPDAGGGDDAKVEGEWMVDGRRSLVSYKAREGGEYTYGKS